MKSYSVSLNFLPIVTQPFEVECWLKRVADPASALEPGDHRWSLRLPGNSGQVPCEVAFTEKGGYEHFLLESSASIGLSKAYLHHTLREKTKSLSASDVELQEGMRRRVFFVLDSYPEGRQGVWLEPYYLSVKRTFGFLCDFEFRKAAEEEFSATIQKLSLSLNNRGERNRDFYYDKRSKLEQFMRTWAPRLFSLKPNLAISRTFEPLQAETLETKRYVFSNHSTANSQFAGITKFGPFRLAPSQVRFYFVFRAQDRASARMLYSALKGDSPDFAFKGIEQMMGLPFNSKVVEGREISSFSDRGPINELAKEIASDAAEIKLPVILLPEDREEAAYFLLKSLFNAAGLAFQGISVATLNSSREFKWSVANIALQIFAKCGGIPWLVDSQVSDALIVGIGKAHHLDFGCNPPRVSKYFAFSILTEANGLFKELRVLGQHASESEYLSELRSNLADLLRRHGAHYSQIVLHTPFKLQRAELEAISKTISDASRSGLNRTQFVVMKINHDNKFWGYNSAANSLIPYESTFVKIGRGSYLVWFEGLQYHTSVVSKPIGGPTHVEFVYPAEGLPGDVERKHLQDLINLSGANWRGFNAKAMPVSTFYCRLVADFIKEFDLRDLPASSFEALKPWFI